MTIADARDEVLALIGNTPMVELTRFETAPCHLFMKLENQNPGGSIKDRIALRMIAAAEKDGRLKPGGTIIEATAGNTGLGLALIAVRRGYKLILVVPDKMSREKIVFCRALGVDVRITRSDVAKGHAGYYQDLAESIAKSMPGSYYINQFSNPANVAAHEETTAPEIWEQMNHDVDAIVCGVGSGGTLTGLGNFFRKHSPKTEIILADPAGSILAPLVNENKKVAPGSWLVEGIGEDFVPDILDLKLTQKAYTIPDDESFRTARELLHREGIFAGSSTGTLLAAALRYCKEQKTPKRVMTFACDTGGRYLSKMFNDAWMDEQRFLGRHMTGTVADLVTRRYREGAVIVVKPTETIRTAYNRMRAADVSQLPVMDGDRIVGLIDDRAILQHVGSVHRAAAFQDPVTRAMTGNIRLTPANAPIESLEPIFAAGHIVIVMDGQEFLGLVTRVDLLNDFINQAQGKA